LTRSLTRTIHDLYTGTKQVQAGNLSQRIPIRTEDQLSDLAGSFNIMTHRIERLIDEVKGKEKLEAELEIARQVQAQLFPRDVPALTTLELIGFCSPARKVSGDYYDFIPMQSGLTAVALGDISGKGISAALLMASLQASLRAQLALNTGNSISTAELVERLNRQLYDQTLPEKYATFYCGVYNDSNGHLLYTNAGHLPPILLRGTNPTRLEATGTVVGIFPDSVFGQSEVRLQPGDLLAVFTDGITEPEDKNGEQFGEARLTELLIANRDKPLDEITRIVTYSVQNWAHDTENLDDTTMLLARRL
jgi:sigma-B regulation protein RsbU (phosphoserine phosphatase)